MLERVLEALAPLRQPAEDGAALPPASQVRCTRLPRASRGLCCCVHPGRVHSPCRCTPTAATLAATAAGGARAAGGGAAPAARVHPRHRLRHAWARRRRLWHQQALPAARALWRTVLQVRGWGGELMLRALLMRAARPPACEVRKPADRRLLAAPAGRPAGTAACTFVSTGPPTAWPPTTPAPGRSPWCTPAPRLRRCSPLWRPFGCARRLLGACCQFRARSRRGRRLLAAHALGSASLHPPASHRPLNSTLACPSDTPPHHNARLQANDEWAAKKARAKALPEGMVEELKAAARACQPGVQYPAL